MLREIAEEIVPGQNSVRRDKGKYTLQILEKNLPPCWSLDYGGVIRMSYFDGKLLPVDDAWDMKSKVFDGTYRQHWESIQDEYNPKAKEIMDEINS